MRRLQTILATLACAALASAGAVERDPAELAAEMDAYMRACVEALDFSGTILVARDGEVVHAKGYGLANRELGVPCTVDTKYRLASITKQFTAVAILQLRDEGALSLDDPMGRYVEGGPGSWKDITLHHLLSHQSGLYDARKDPNYETWSRIPARPLDLMKYVVDKPLEFEPGSQFAYSNSGYVVLAAILETVSGESWEDYLRAHVFEPLGMENTGHDTHAAILPQRASGYTRAGAKMDGEVINAPYHDMDVAIGGGDLYSTVGDVLLWDQALYGDVVLGAASRAAMMTPNRSSYGYGVRIVEQLGRRRVAHGGGINGFRTQLSRFVDDRVTVVVLSNAQWAAAGLIAQDLAAVVFGESYALPEKGHEKH